MKKEYIILIFFLCFSVWVMLVDIVPVPGFGSLKQDVGVYSRYKVKEWNEVGGIDLIKDELIVYAVVDNQEQIYYIDYQPHYVATLKNLSNGTGVQMRYVRGFPKYWKRHLYDMRVNGQSVLSYSQYYLEQKRREIRKVSMIVGGVFVFLVVLGFINKPRSKKKR